MVNELPNGWQSMELEQVMDAILDYRGKSPKKTNSGVPLVTAKIVKDGRINDATEFIAADDYDSWMRRGLPKIGDVLLTTEAPLGEVAQIRDARIALAQRLVALRGKSEILDNTFLKFLLQSAYIQNELLSRSTGTTVVGIKQRELRRIDLHLPPIDEQRKIGSILGTLDDKIELNRQMNHTLEAMARAIFNAWFVDFEPVKAKADGATSFRGMSQQVFDQLPDRFTESELGPVPEGWDVKRLDELMIVNPKRVLKKGNIAPYLPMSEMPTRGHVPVNLETREFGSGVRFANGDTLLSRITPCLENGKTAFVDFLPEGVTGWGSTEYIVIRPKSPLPEVYAYCLARSSSFRDFAIKNMTGTSGRQRVPGSAIEGFKTVEPCEQLAEEFGSVVGPLFAMSSGNHRQSRTLASIRDTLLPKLISGEIRVPKAMEDADGG